MKSVHVLVLSSISLVCQVVYCIHLPTKNNVCKKISAYATLLINNQECWYNPDVRSSLEQILVRSGYRSERHKVTTEDGYILTLFRIPAASVSASRPILLQHGIGGSGVFWMLHGPDSLALFLSRNGFDVWLSTTRGGLHSRRHERLTTSDPEYWNYSFHEHGIYDLPAMIGYISKVTGKKGNITFIGHSMGTTMSYVYAILRKKHAEAHLNGIISFAPVAHMGNIRGLYKFLAPFSEKLVRLLNGIGIYALGVSPIDTQIVSRICGTFPSVILCELVLSLTNGLSISESRPDLLPVFGSYFPDGTSLKLVNHFAQDVISGKLQFFDYGDENVARYNASIPPLYDLNAISLPVHLFVGRQDYIGNLQDAEMFYRQLKSNGVPTSMNVLDFAHNDFFLAAHLEDLYRQLLKTLDVLNN